MCGARLVTSRWSSVAKQVNTVVSNGNSVDSIYGNSNNSNNIKDVYITLHVSLTLAIKL